MLVVHCKSFVLLVGRAVGRFVVRCCHVNREGAAVAYWLERRIRDRNEDFEREFDSPLTHTLSKVRDAQ